MQNTFFSSSLYYVICKYTHIGQANTNTSIYNTQSEEIQRYTHKKKHSYKIVM